MKKVILDTNFILTCVKQKIDFFEELKNWGLEILIPEQVFFELKKIIHSKKKAHFRRDAELTLKLLEKNKDNFEKINLKNKDVDKALINLGKKENIIIGTLDKEIRQQVNKNLIIRNRKVLEII